MKTRLFLALAALGAGCGAEPPVATETGALVTGAANVSDGLLPSSIAESETAAVGLGNAWAVAYNSFNDPKPNERCSGYSEIGLSFPVNFGSLRTIHMPVPSGMAVLRTDPSIAAWDAGSSYQVFVSALANSSAQWNAQPKLADGCLDLSSFNALGSDNVCVFTVTMTKNGTLLSGGSVTSVLCQASPNGADGTAVTASGGKPYVATFSGNSITYFTGDGVARTVPFGRTMLGHPIWTKNTTLDMFAPDFAGQFWEISYNASTGGWSTPFAGPSGFKWNGQLPLGLKGGKEYAAAYLPGSAGPGATYLFFQQGDYLVGYSHASGGIPGWSNVFTSAPARGYHPAVAIATIPNQFPPYSGFHLGLTYWDDSGSLRYATGGLTSITTLATETPCSFHGYWGDYDEMFVTGNNTTSPYFYRAFTDSTKSACGTAGSDWSTAIPQHVSVIRAPGPVR